MEPLTPAQRDRLLVVTKFAMDEIAKDTPADKIIYLLEADHAATVSVKGSAYTLRAAGVVGSCTWSRDSGLLSSWRKNATVRLMIQ